jgi:hypothetical protein
MITSYLWGEKRFLYTIQSEEWRGGLEDTIVVVVVVVDDDDDDDDDGDGDDSRVLCSKL